MTRYVFWFSGQFHSTFSPSLIHSHIHISVSCLEYVESIYINFVCFPPAALFRKIQTGLFSFSIFIYHHYWSICWNYENWSLNTADWNKSNFLTSGNTSDFPNVLFHCSRTQPSASSMQSTATFDILEFYIIEQSITFYHHSQDHARPLQCQNFLSNSSCCWFWVQLPVWFSKIAAI